MNSRKLAGASAASVGAATAVVALLLGTVSGNADEDKDIRSSAFGVAADGLLDIDPTPYVDAPPDDSEALLEVPGEDSELLRIALLKVKAQDFRSQATAVDVEVAGINIELIEAKCENGEGDSSIIGGVSDNGTPLPSDPFDGQELDLSPVLSIEFNRQERDGDKLTVDALVVKLLPGGDLGTVIQQKDLDLLKKVAPKDLKVPSTMQEVKSDNPQAPDAQADPTQPGTPANPAESGPVTLGDLTEKIQSLNPNLVPKADGDDDALLEVIVSSASCREERKKDEKPEEAPKPKPVEADLPVTH
ncbi:MAG: hypothetical protein M3257_03355 [Actinomycetota bacterium]|nr:hypothetical protein [Actinomycetota bacterium]